MKFMLSAYFLLLSAVVLGQDSTVIPRETSFENYDLLVVALVGLAVLLALYFLWRRRKK